MTKKILSIQNISCETLGTFEDLLVSEGYVLNKVLAPIGPVPQSAIEFSAIILLGGPMSVYEGIPYLNKEQSLIRDAFRRNIPILGVCLGSQLIAGALGGTVYKGAKKEIGWYDVKITDNGLDSLFKGLQKKELRVFQWHGDTYTLPQDAVVLAYTDLYPQAFRIGSAYGLQFHLEVTTDMIKVWTEEYRNEIRREGIELEKIKARNKNEIQELNKKCNLVWSNFSDIIRRNEIYAG
jgi:GMP synthase-like glutamine amidotransferase